MRLAQGLFDMRHVPDTERDSVGIEDAIGKAQLFGILAAPHQTVDPAFHGTFKADIEHILVDVRHRDAGATVRHAESDVASPPSHVEYRFAMLRLHTSNEAVFP